MIGASIGSFLNVVIYRLPLGLSIQEPKNSFCPKCKARLTLPDLIPLLSWLVLRGRCRHCQVGIPARYFIVELVTGVLFALFWWQNLIAGSDPIRALFLCALAAALVSAFFIDVKYYIIPDQVNAAMLIIGLLYNVSLFVVGSPRAMTWGMPSAIAGALVGTLTIWFITLLGRLLFGKDAMGHGDIKMARGFGAVLFPAATGMTIGLAVIVGAVGGIAQLLVRKAQGVSDEPAGDEDEEPYEPESIASIFKCGLGYLLAIDVVGLFRPKLYESWFGENPYALESVEEEDDFVGLTTIPFGPYLAIGAVLAALFEPQLATMIETYIYGPGRTL